MSQMEVNKLKEAEFLHDIGKIVVDDRILTKVGSLTEEEWKEMQQHAMVGYRILNLFDETMDLAEGILNHHENWNGTGYPKGLKGQQIHMLARIIKVAESYDSMTNSLDINRMTKEATINEIVSQSGIKYNPDIVDVFENLIYDSL